MAELLVVKNAVREGPGLLAGVMQEHGVSYDVVDLDCAQQLPASPNDYQALVVLGGPDSANDFTPRMESELSFVQDALDREMPYFGVGLGMQVGVLAAGGKVVPSPVKEVAFANAAGEHYGVRLTDAGTQDPLLTDMPGYFRVFQLHDETVELAPGMELLGMGTDCENQLVRFGDRAYGMQSHVEVTPGMLSVWRAGDLALQHYLPDKLIADLREVGPWFKRTTNTMFTNFLDIAGLIERS
ncbi:MAG TPA: type 1 glutamine amidotransferase [Candidatus Saccharimonadales bacterium]|nr:type 1 glutamine amidotransferase [Candidatus Saccharimonadales bacterium]